jgi:glycosyltransferase
MKISIITPCLNSAATIEKTILSVISQTYKNIEYIIIDGGSTDETLNIVKKCTGSLDVKIISEPDKGIYDAMNKGLKLATGEVVGILNSDDFYYNNQVLEKITNVFQKDEKLSLVYGDIIYKDHENLGKIKRYWRAGDYSESKIKNGWIMPHPAVFARQSLYQEFGLFNDSFKIAADYEIMLRWLLVKKITPLYLPEVLTVMGVGGVSGRNFKQRLRGWRELKKAWRVNTLTFPRFFILRRILSKLKQLFTSPHN